MSSNAVNITGCLICGADLHYRKQMVQRTCHLCGEKFPTHAECSSGHFICDRCHRLPALDLIEQTCGVSSDTDSLRLAASLMSNPEMKMHGPEHHFLVPAVLIAACCTVQGDDSKREKLKAARRRAEDVKGGFCGFHGACGAAVGAGIACSVLTGATPLSRDEWRLSNLMTAACLTTIAEAGGPRCCKRDTYLALLTARDFLNFHLNSGLPTGSQPTCSFSDNNKECLETGCRFFPDTET